MPTALLAPIFSIVSITGCRMVSFFGRIPNDQLGGCRPGKVKILAGHVVYELRISVLPAEGNDAA